MSSFLKRKQCLSIYDHNSDDAAVHKMGVVSSNKSDRKSIGLRVYCANKHANFLFLMIVINY